MGLTKNYIVMIDHNIIKEDVIHKFLCAITRSQILACIDKSREHTFYTLTNCTN